MMKVVNLENSAMNRREFFSFATGIASSVLLLNLKSLGLSSRNGNCYSVGKKLFNTAQKRGSETKEIFNKIIKLARKKGWTSFPIGELVGKIALLFLDTQYMAGTLEGKGPEVCRIDLTGLDCVTFFENVLCISRILKKGKTSFDDFEAEIIFTRYREGVLTDYTSRLHYLSDWIYDNEKKKVVRNITKEIGGKEFPFKVSFMSENPHYYQALKEFPEFIEKIAILEREINERQHWYIPQSKLKEAEKYIQTGDIIALATDKEGLDYGHTGLVYQDEKEKIRFLHASQNKKKVFLDVELYKYVRSTETNIGVTVARPLEVKPMKSGTGINS